ncbi:MAG: ABC transporter permease [Rickettsiales bacterium]|jgi:putative ABC transport system permease protein|nr:ABC transporter permease [Rickettsiales bacterium]
MNIYQIAYKNLYRQKTRTIITISGIALSMWILVTLLGFNNGYKSSLDSNIDGMGFQIMLVAKGCPYEAATLMLKGGTGLRYLQEDIVENVIKEPEVDGVSRMLMEAVFDPNKGENGGTTIYLGVDDNYLKLKPYNKFRNGQWFTADEQVILGFEAAELEQREVGDYMLINDKEYEVVGILDRNGTQDDGMIFIPLNVLQREFNRKNQITMLGIKLNKDVEQDVFEEKLYELQDVQIVSMAQIKNTIMSLISSARVIVMVIVFVAFIIATFGVLNTILMTIFERYQEIGILKTMGATPKDIFLMVLFESIVLCGVGGIIGISFSFIFSGLSEFCIRQLLPFVPNGNIIQITFETSVVSFVSIIVVGIIGGIYPSLKASSIKPLEAIRSL